MGDEVVARDVFVAIAANCRQLGAEGKGLFEEVETKTLKKLFAEAIIVDRNNEE